MKTYAMPKIILASASPRRKEILGSLGVPFTVKVSKKKEPEYDGLELPEEFACVTARSKLENVIGRRSSVRDDTLVLAYDTIVAVNGRIFGKPKDENDVRNMLGNLSGSTHSVYTGFAFYYKKVILTGFEETKVTFKNLTRKEIDDYIASEKPYDKAGAYAIQEGGGGFVRSIDGDYDNVVGLPLDRTRKELKSAFGITL